MSEHTIRFELNGQPREVRAPAHRLLLHLLRDELGYTGTKEGCTIGVCGICSVLVNGAFIRYGGFQRGICTPGQIASATALLNENATPSRDEIRQWMMGNLCRCTGYYKIVQSIEAAAAVMRGR